MILFFWIAMDARGKEIEIIIYKTSLHDQAVYMAKTDQLSGETYQCKIISKK